MMTRVVLYARVSTDDKGQSVDNQLEVLRRWAVDLGFVVYKEFVDEGVSGANSNRPAFLRLRSEARQRRFNGLLVWSIDRLSREGISQTFAYIEEFERYGVFLRSYSEGWLDTMDGMIKPLMLSMWAWFASFERQRMSERIKAGIQRRKNIGQYRGGRPRKHPPLSESSKKDVGKKQVFFKEDEQ